MKKLSLLVALLACACALSFAQGGVSTSPPIVVNQYGAPIPFATVTVCTTNPGTGACGALATTYTDWTASTTCSGSGQALNNISNPAVGSGCSNPGTADALGNVVAFVASGASYWCQYSGANVQTYTQPCVFPSTAAQGLLDPGSNGILYRSGLYTTRIAVGSDVIGLFSGTCNTTSFLRGDASCSNTLTGPFSATQLTLSGSGGTIDIPTQTAPSNPASGVLRLYANSGSGLISCLNSSGGNCFNSGAVTSVFSRTGAVTAQANDYTWNQIGAGSNLNTETMGTAGSLAPTALGQVAGSQAWGPMALLAPALSQSTSCGSLLSGHVLNVQYVFTSAAGNSLVGPSTSISVAANNNCVTVTAPTVPSGYTGYTVYANDQNVDSLFHLQNASNNCSNITANCIIQSVTTAAQPSTTITAYVQPAGIQATECPPGVMPFIFTPDQSGNYHTSAGVDFSSSNSQTSGTLEFCRRTWFTDMQVSPVGGNNAFIAIDHESGVGTSASNDDRALWVYQTNPTNDSATRYALQGVNAEIDFNCNGCNINGSPDGEVSTGSFQLSLAGASTNWTTNGYGTNAIQGRIFRSGSGIDTSGPMAAIYGNASNSNSTASGGAGLYALRGKFSSGTNATNLQIGGLWLDLPSSRNASFVKGIVFNCSSCFTPTFGSDFLIDQRLHNWYADWNTQMGMNTIDNSDGSTSSLGVNASLNVSGAITATPMATSWSASGVYSASCSGGSSQYGYQLVAVDANGGQSASGNISTSAACVNPLTSGNPVTLNPQNSGITSSTIFRQAIRIDVYRISGPMATGKIGSLTCNSNIIINTCNSFTDSGLSVSGSVPTVNTTGGIFAGGDIGFNTGKGQHFDAQAAANDFAGTCTLSSGSCTVTFTRAYASAPVCIATPSTSGTFTTGAALKVAPSTSSLVVSSTTGTDSAVIDYICVGNPN